MAKRRYTRREMEKIYKRRRIMVSFIAVVILVLFGYGVYGVVRLFTKDNEETKAPEQEQQVEDSKDNSLDENDKDKIDITGNSNVEEEIKDEQSPLGEGIINESDQVSEAEGIGSSTDWNLVLANPDTALPKDFTVDTAVVQGSMQVDTRIVDIAKTMLDDAKKDGIDLLVCSGYRSVERQTNLFENSINGYMAQGYSKEDALKYTKSYYAMPGTSEHHTGLAMDIVTPAYQTLDDQYAETDAAKWLLNNAHKYGFILRYPKDKEDLTKIKFEPWHYRYVGEEHAKIIKEKNLCFEEYIKTIK